MSLTTSIPITFIVVLVGGLFLFLKSRNYLFPVITIKSPWLAGGLLLVINSVIIGITFLISFHLVGSMMILEIVSPLVSIMAWIWIKSSLNGRLKERFISSIVGQSIYVVLLLICLFQYANLKPSYPGEDTFMAAIGLLIGMVVCFFATIIGLAILLTPHPKA